jgi:DNA-binding NarL/FixJ family response regulator
VTVVLTGNALGQLRNAGLRQPRPPVPGQEWKPRTEAEQHLLREGYRLDRVRLVLLEEIGRLRQQAERIPRREAIAAATKAAERLKDCPLTQAQHTVIAAAAAGESVEETAHRLCLSYDTIKSQRVRAVSRLGARSITHAVAICVAAGWITDRQVTEGVTP